MEGGLIVDRRSTMDGSFCCLGLVLDGKRVDADVIIISILNEWLESSSIDHHIGPSNASFSRSSGTSLLELDTQMSNTLEESAANRNKVEHSVINVRTS